MLFAPYDYIIVYSLYKVNNTDCTFCKIRNDYYIVYNAKWGTWVAGRGKASGKVAKWQSKSMTYVFDTTLTGIATT